MRRLWLVHWISPRRAGRLKRQNSGGGDGRKMMKMSRKFRRLQGDGKRNGNGHQVDSASVPEFRAEVDDWIGGFHPAGIRSPDGTGRVTKTAKQHPIFVSISLPAGIFDGCRRHNDR